MSSNRLIYDTCAYKKELDQSVGPLNYTLYPGKYQNCSKCRIELGTVGGNNVSLFSGNLVDLENDLRGMSRNLNRDQLCQNNYEKFTAKSEKINYPTCNPFTEQSRATHPAWELRDLEQINWQYLPYNPQQSTCIPFQNNLNTRILEKDYFIAEAPCLKTTSLS